MIKTPLKWGSYWMVLGILGLSGERVSYSIFPSESVFINKITPVPGLFLL
jgi:hypothetical protein